MKNHRIIAYLTIIGLLVFVLAGCTSPAGTTTTTAKTTTATTTAATTDPYKTAVHFTATGLHELTEGMDYGSDAVFKAISEKFNFTYELYPLTWDNWGEKNRLWISAGDMPDMTFWGFNFTEYVSYAEQGLIGAMPDGWENKYPDLHKMIQASGISEKLKLDGKTYAIPKTMFMLFAPVDKNIHNSTFFYRDDLRKEVGLEPFGQMITLDQMEDYLAGCVAKGLVQTGAGLSSSYDNIVRIFVSMHNSGYNSFYKDNGQYVWGPAQPETLAGIKLLKSYYDKNVIDPDFYLNTSKEHRNKFASGLMTMIYDEGTIDNVSSRIQEFAAANPDMDAFDTIRLTNVLGPDGKWHGQSYANFWSATVFSPSTDVAVLNRIMAIFNFLATKEGQELISLGIEGTDWERTDDGYKILRKANDDGTFAPIKSVYPSCAFWFTLALLPEDFSFVDPTRDRRVVDAVVDMHGAKEEVGNILWYDPDFAFFTSDAKSAYSVDTASEIVRIIMTDNVNIDDEWAKFIKAQQSMYQPVLDDLNAAFGN